jgi:hypothetical protein
MKFHALLTLTLCALAAPARAAPAESLRELTDQIGACLALPPDGELTIHMTLGRGGALLGTPHIAFNTLALGAAQERRVIETTAREIERCLPAAISPALGRTIAGRSLRLRFTAKRREIEV